MGHPHPPLPLHLSTQASQDIVDILQYTAETWGQAQLLVYQDIIDRALQAIAARPQAGRQRDDLPPTHRAYLAGAHIIIYRLHADGIGVVRILHQRMQASRYLAEPPKFEGRAGDLKP